MLAIIKNASTIYYKQLIAGYLLKFTKILETQIAGDPKSFWHFVSSSRSGNSGVPPSVRLDNDTATERQDI